MPAIIVTPGSRRTSTSRKSDSLIIVILLGCILASTGSRVVLTPFFRRIPWFVVLQNPETRAAAAAPLLELAMVMTL